MDGRQIDIYTITEVVNAFSLPNNLAAGIYMCRFSGDDGSTVIANLVYQP